MKERRRESIANCEQGCVGEVAGKATIADNMLGKKGTHNHGRPQLYSTLAAPLHAVLPVHTSLLHPFLSWVPALRVEGRVDNQGRKLTRNSFGRSFINIVIISSNTSGTQGAPPSKVKKYSLHIEANGAIIGEGEKKWSTKCGKLIRAHIPIGYDDWRNVDWVYRNALWNSLMAEFEFNIDPFLARPLLETRFPQFLRTMKYHLRDTIKNKEGIFLPKPVALAQCPDDIDKIWWEHFIANEYTPKKIEQRKKNAENKALSKINHTLGRKSYNRVYKELAEEHPGEVVTRSEAWKRAHKNKALGL